MISSARVSGSGRLSRSVKLLSLSQMMSRLVLSRAVSSFLTADHDKAEQCLICAMGECVEWIGVFTDWAHSWSRRAVLKRAIQMIMPVPEHADKVSIITLQASAASGEDNSPFAAILLLDPFERFVFVMTTLEGQSDASCPSGAFKVMRAIRQS
jgi:hypothetical protein